MENPCAMLAASETLELATNHPHFPKVTLTYGELDMAAEVAYGWGYCLAMMDALAEKTGWNSFWGAYEAADPCEPLHVAVQRPDGLLVDVDGAMPTTTTEMAHPDYGPYRIEWRPLNELHVDHWQRFQTKAIGHARTITDAVLYRAARVIA